MALGLLALLDTSGMYMDKALQLRYLSSEALAFLDSSLDLAYILMNAPEQKPKDISLMRFSKANFSGFGGHSCALWLTCSSLWLHGKY